VAQGDRIGRHCFSSDIKKMNGLPIKLITYWNPLN
jgi:hypothetical protein